MPEDTERRSEGPGEQEIIEEFEDALDLPMAVLALVTLILVVLQFSASLDPRAKREITLAITFIWWLFVIEFTLEVFIAKDRRRFIKTHWLEAIAVFLPVLRVFSVFRGLQALRVIVSTPTTATARALLVLKRGFQGFAGSLGMRSFPIVLGLTVVVGAIGSLGMYFIERHASGATMTSLGDAAWWTIGTITTVGTELYPVTGEGRVVAALLMIYGVSVFGYIAAVLASYFVRMDSRANRRSTES